MKSKSKKNKKFPMKDLFGKHKPKKPKMPKNVADLDYASGSDYSLKTRVVDGVTYYYIKK